MELTQDERVIVADVLKDVVDDALGTIEAIEAADGEYGVAQTEEWIATLLGIRKKLRID